MNMEVKIENSRLVKPLYQGTPPLSSNYTPLSVFDKVTYDVNVAAIRAYRPPTSPNATIELGLRKTLAVYRELAGRLGKDNDGNPIILLNDEGVRFVEASIDHVLDETMLLKPSAFLLSLHPKLHGVVELFQVQLTRFACGSMVVGSTINHLIADGHSTLNFVVSWSQATRGLPINPLPFRDRTIFSPRKPLKCEFEHVGTEYITKDSKKSYPTNGYNVEDIVIHRVHYTLEFLSKLKVRASSMSGNNKPFSTFESLVAHIWRTITKARGINRSETTEIRIAIDGRARLNPRVPEEYFGNLVLWAFPRAKVDDLLSKPLSYATNVVHEAIVNVNDDYFRSFIDFANNKEREEDLVPTADPNKAILWPNVKVDSWLKFPFSDLDFGHGGPHMFMPSFFPIEGMFFPMPSFTGDGSINAFIPLFHQNLPTFKQVCYDLDLSGSDAPNQVTSGISRL